MARFAMARFLFGCLCAMLLCHAQDRGPGLADFLNFEGDQPGGIPRGWNGGPPTTIFADGQVVHGGRWSVRFERHSDSPQTFSQMNRSMAIDFAGATVELRGFLRTEEVSDFAGFWMREDGDSGSVEFDNMQARQIKGTTGWTEYSIKLPVNKEGKRLVYGVLMGGTGKAWADDLQLLVDGKPVWEAPKAERPKTILDTDREFDGGSKIILTELTKAQTANLVTLGKVWGFLKYHHPEVTSGKRQWDYELFRVLPAILAAPDRAAANTALRNWTDGLGSVAACEACARLDENKLHLRPDLNWIGDQAALGKELSGRLQAIHKNRLAGKQFYVSLMPGVGNPSFDRELAYQSMAVPDGGFQLLAVYRFWNIIEYWSPYRGILGENWDQVLAEFIPRVALARNAEDYQRELMALIARDHDTHANLWSSIQVRPPAGACQIPVVVRFVENQAVVTGYTADEPGKATGLKAGDAILELDGVPVPNLVESWAPYYAVSNEAARMRDMARSLTRGACGDVKVRVRRANETVAIATSRSPGGNPGSRSMLHDRPGDTFQRLPDNIAYLKLSSVKIAEAAGYIDSAAGTKGLIVDIRNYPSEFVVFALGELLVEKETEFARFTVGDLANPGAFQWRNGDKLQPKKPHYSGKVVILVDEDSQSQAEYTSMAFRTAPGAKVVGSTTAGADGNVSPFALPGSLKSMISGIGVFYPDGRPTQRVGIVPDVEVRPTIAGIRAGKDEVLDAAVRLILAK
jgi:C-terminal processing protease CtpA/Prc